MKRLAAFLVFASAAFLLGHPGCGPHTHDNDPPPPLPNIVMILTDDQRVGLVDPHMPQTRDLIGGQGATFTKSYVSDPICCPSRAITYSGRYAHNTGVVFNRPTDDPEGGADFDAGPTPLGTDPRLNGGAVAFDEASNIACELQKKGYTTALFGKWMNSMDLYPMGEVPSCWDEISAFHDDGFNFFNWISIQNFPPPANALDAGVPAGGLQVAIQTGPGVWEVSYGSTEAEYATDVTNAWAVDFIDRHPAGPFFLVWAPYAPHFDVGFYSVTAAPRHAGQSATAGNTFFESPAYDEGDVGRDPITDKPEWLQNKLATVMNSPAGVEANLVDFRHETVDSLKAVDEGVFNIIAKLDGTTNGQDTFIVYTSDNGYLWGEHGIGMKSSMYEESAKVPLLIRFLDEHPAAFPTVQTEVVSNVDLAATFADLAGIPCDGGVTSICQHDGHSLRPIVAAQPVTWRTHTLIEGWQAESTVPNIAIPGLFPIQPDRAAVVNGTHKLVDYETGTDELYDLVADPYELQNQINNPDYDAIEAQLRAELATLVAQ